MGRHGARQALVVGHTEPMVYESAHISTTIDRRADDVYAFASDPRNLARWASGLANGVVESHDGAWVVESPMGRVTVAFAPPNPFGILDHRVTLPSGETVDNPMRVIPNADGCDVVFTVHRRAASTPKSSPPTQMPSPPTSPPFVT